MQDKEKVLSFAKEQAGELSVRLVIEEKTGDGFSIKKDGRSYIITGNNPRSCLYGVYHIKDGFGQGTFTTSWNIRGIYATETLSRHSEEQMRKLIDRMGKWRFNTFVAYTAYGYKEHISLIEEECARRGIDIIYYYNTAFQFMKELDPEKNFARDPEGRLWTESIMCETRPCLREPDVMEKMEKSMELFFRKELPSNHKNLLFAPSDGYKVCSCDYCRRLTPMEQWLPLQDGILKHMRKYAPDRQVLSQIYVHRYRPPADLGSYKDVDRIFFDTHQRDRWHPLGHGHPPTVFHRESEVDWSAKNTPLNVYFLDRIKEWLNRLGKPVVLFENLMVQGTLSCGQFNTSVLIEDLRILEKIGVDGMLYEGFEPGIESFSDEFTHLSWAMWDTDYKYQPGGIESWALQKFEKQDKSIDFNTEIGTMGNLVPAVLPSFPWDTAREEMDHIHFEYLGYFARFNQRITLANAANVIDHIYEYPERFDRLFIGFWILRRLFRDKGIEGLTPREENFLSFEKLWDFMEIEPQPRKAVDKLIHSIREKL